MKFIFLFVSQFQPNSFRPTLFRKEKPTNIYSGGISAGRRIDDNVYTDRLTGSPRPTEKNPDVGVGEGISYLINRQTGAEVLLSYQSQSEPISTDRLINTGSTIGIRLGLVALLSKP